MRRRLPPWPILVSLAAIVIARVGNTRLAFRLRIPWSDSAMDGAMAALLLLFWLFPPRREPREGDSGEAGSTALRLAGLLALTYAAFMPLCVQAHHGDTRVCWALLYRPLYSFLLLQPFARLLARLRLDAGLLATEALGPAALFFFWGLMVPATVQNLAHDAPKVLAWLQLIVPLATALLLIPYLVRSPAARASRLGELGRLSLRYWRLPVLLLVGELCTALAGTLGTLD